LAAAHAGLPGFEPRFIDLPNEPGRSIILLGSVSGEPAQVFVSGDGQLLGSRENEQLRFGRRHLMDTLYALHVDLMLGGVGVWFIGLIALAWILDHIVAAALAVPRLSKWREALAVHGKVGSLRRLFDLHRAPGLWVLPITLVIAVSGFCLSWYDESRALVGAFSTLSIRLHEEFPDIQRPPTSLSVEDALLAARRHGTGPADSVLILDHKSAYGIRSFDERDIDPYGRLWTYISMSDGRLLGQRHDLGESAGDAFFAWQYPLHSGKAFGLVGRLLIAGAGIGTMVLCVTGVILWWRRRRVLTGG
jgi:uncharacterized iron-regulated membrane protein